MSSVNKRHRNSRGSMQGQYRYTDGSSDMSSVGGFMDETDREVSSLTDRAFRSLCIGEEAIYNDSDFTSPVQRHKAFAEETVTLQELFSVDDRQERVEGKPAFAATFQHSLVQMARQEHGIQYGPFVSNGAIESSWQHRRSTSRVSSLIQVFNSTDTGHGVAPHQDERVSTGTLVMDSDPWDRSGGLNFQNASGIPTSHPPDTLSLAKNYLFSSSNDPTVPPVTTPNSKASTSKFRKLSSTKNLFLHSEFSPFQTWKDYKRFQCQQNTVVNPATHSGGPQWYDSPLYKDLTAAHAVQGAVSEERKYCRKQNENRIPSEPPRSNVLQKASAIEKRCESEITSNCPPWRRSRNPLNGQLLANRPCTASLYNEKYQRQEEALVSAHRTPAVHHQVLTLVDETSNSSTPFNISQLLTPVIYPRQETETSEILNYSPSHDSLILKDTDPRSQSEVKQRDNYKAMASSLLFNLKDNRKRVKSTYSPTKFKTLEITDRSKQPSKQENSTHTAERTISGVHGLQSLGLGAENSHSGNGLVLEPKNQNIGDNMSDEYLTLISPPTTKEATHGGFNKAIKGDQAFENQKNQYGSSPFVVSKSSEVPCKRKLGQPTWKQQQTSSLEQEITNTVPREECLHSISLKDRDDVQGETVSVKENKFKSIGVIDKIENVPNEMTAQTFNSDHKVQVKTNVPKTEVLALNDKGKVKTANSSMKEEEVALNGCDIHSHLEVQRGSNVSQGVLAMKEKYELMTEPYVSLDRNSAKLGLLPAKQADHSANKVTEGHVRKEVLKIQASEISQGNHEMLTVRKHQPVLHSQNEGPAQKGHDHRGRLPDKSKNVYSAKEIYPAQETNLATRDVHLMKEPLQAPVGSFSKRESGKTEQKAATGKINLPNTEGVTSDGHQREIKQGILSKRDHSYSQNYTTDFKDERSETKQDLLNASIEQPPSKQANAVKENRSGKTNQGQQMTKGEFAHVEFASANEEIKATGGNISITQPEVKTIEVEQNLENQQDINETSANKACKQEKSCRLPVPGGEEIRHTAVQNELVKNKAATEGKRDAVDSKLAKMEFSVVKELGRMEKEVSLGSYNHSSGQAMFKSKRDDQSKHTDAKKENGHDGFVNKHNPKPKHKKFAFNERDHVMHEILASKIMAHAQKEIFAIKEKGYGKWEAIATSEKEPGPKRGLFVGRGRGNDHYGSTAASADYHAKLKTIPREGEKQDLQRAQQQNSKETRAADVENEAENSNPVSKESVGVKEELAHMHRTVSGQDVLPQKENLQSQNVSNVTSDTQSAKPHGLSGTGMEERRSTKEPRVEPKTICNKHEFHSNIHSEAENSEVRSYSDPAAESKEKSNARQWSREKEHIRSEKSLNQKSPQPSREKEHAEGVALENNPRHSLQSEVNEKNEKTVSDEGCLAKQAIAAKGKKEDARINEGENSQRQEVYSLRETGSVQNGSLKVKNEGDRMELKGRKGEELSIEEDKKEVLATIEKDFARINVFAITRKADTEVDICSMEHKYAEGKHEAVKERQHTEQEGTLYQHDSGSVPQVKEAEKLLKSETEAKEKIKGELPAKQIHIISETLATTELYKQDKQPPKDHDIHKVPEPIKENAKPVVLAKKELSRESVSAANGIAESSGEAGKQIDQQRDPATNKHDKKEVFVTKENKKMEATTENICFKANVEAPKKHDGRDSLAKEQHPNPELLEKQNMTKLDISAGKECAEAQIFPLNDPHKVGPPSLPENAAVFTHDKPAIHSTVKNTKLEMTAAKNPTDLEATATKQETNCITIATHESAPHNVLAGNGKTKSELFATEGYGNIELNYRSVDNHDRSAIFTAKECNKNKIPCSPECNKEELLTSKNYITSDVFATRKYSKSEVLETENHTTQDIIETKEWSKPNFLVQKGLKTDVAVGKEDFDQSARLTRKEIILSAPVLKEDPKPDMAVSTEPLEPSAPAGKELKHRVLVTKETSKPDLPVTDEPASPPIRKELIQQNAPVAKEYSEVDAPVTTGSAKPCVPTGKEHIKQHLPATKKYNKPDVPVTTEPAKSITSIGNVHKQSAHVIKENSKPDDPVTKELARPCPPARREVVKQSTPVTKEHTKSDVPVTAEPPKPSISTGKELIKQNAPKEHLQPNTSVTDHYKQQVPVKTEQSKPDVAIRKELNEQRIPTDSPKPGLPPSKQPTKSERPKAKDNLTPDMQKISTNISGTPSAKELVVSGVHTRQKTIHSKPKAFPLPLNSNGKVKYEHIKNKDAPFPLSYPSQHQELASEESDVLYKHTFTSKEYSKTNKKVLTDKECDRAGNMYAQTYKPQELLSGERNKVKEQLIANEDHDSYDQDILNKQEKTKTVTHYDKGKMFLKENQIPKQVHASKEKDKREIAAKLYAMQKAANMGDHDFHIQSAVLPLQVNGGKQHSGCLEQPLHVDRSIEPIVDSYLSMEDVHQNLMQEPQLHAELENTHHGVDRKEVKNNKEIEGLEYYALSNYKTDTESKGGMAALPHIDEKMPRKGRVESGSSDPDESRWTHHSTDPTKASRYTPQLDTLSPPLGKPTMFKVKDNTFRTSPVTKAVKPSFYKTFPEKGEEQHDHLTEHADLPAVHHSAVMSNRFPHPRQRLPHQVLSPSDMSTAKERGGYFRRNPVLEEDECCSIASVFSEDMEGYAASTADVADERTAVLRNIEEAEDFRDASERPEVKPLGKPPTVPPKTEKALRRAQKLTTRRIKKAEARLDGNSHVGQKAVRAVSSVPASPTGLLLPHSPMPGPPSAPRFCIETGYVAPAPNLVAQSFPLTQRKLLQDPNSGQYFVVDMPVQVKTKMFFDPETGKYVQLSVHQAPEGTLSPASSVELLNPPYVLYPGFLPMQVPSLPPLRSSSQMSAPATLVEDQERLEVAESWAQKGYHQRTSREAQPYIEPVYLSAQHLPEESSHVEGKNTGSSRNLSIISMSELEDFAVEST